MYNSSKLYILFIALFLVSCQDSVKKPMKVADFSKPLYKELSFQESGIDFRNTIVETNDKNHLKWSAFYSGSGVAVGDINNDGLLDICYAGNQVNDALYLNKGNLAFENITKTSGLKMDGGWSTGISMADVNNDGLLDIYICRANDLPSPQGRANLLYINNGDETFTEQGAAYGLNDTGYSMQGTFFDHDRDGDLDLFLLNQPPDARLITRFGLDIERNKHHFLDKFYINNGAGRFIESSKAAGLDGYGYGLNAVASDLNNDGLTDIYVTNDYFEPDFMYINNGDGTYKNTINESIKHISNFAMGSDVADFDNDGLVDIGVVDMAAAGHFRSKTNMGSMRPERFWKLVEEGNHYQYMFNTLQKNNGNGSFSEIGLMAGIAKTDWSWSFLMNDLDNDGYKDIVITNGIKKDIRNNDFQYKIKALNEKGQKQFQVAEVLNLIPSTPLTNFIYRNEGGDELGAHSLSFKDYSQKWGFTKPGFSHGMAMGDLDNDGDLDMVINNSNDFGSIYENIWGNQQNFLRIDLDKKNNKILGRNAKVTIEYNDKVQHVELTGTKGYLSNSECVAHFGLGDVTEVDRAIIDWVDGTRQVVEKPQLNKIHFVKKYGKAKSAKNKNENSILIADNKIVQPDFVHKEDDFDDFKREVLLPHKQSEHGPHISVGDVNGDQFEDFYIGGAAGYSGALYLGSALGKFTIVNNNVWESEAKYEDLGSIFFDFDGDGDEDLYVVSGGSTHRDGHDLYADRLYENKGKGQFVRNTSALPKLNPLCGEVVRVSDVDGDGDIDIFVGGRNRPGKYPQAVDSYLLINNKGRFKKDNFLLAPDFKNIGMVTDAIFTDFDGDKDEDLLVVGEWMQIMAFKNEDGNFKNVTKAMGLADSRSWWWSIEEGDFDKDGDMDYIVGNLGKNTKYKASKDKPFSIYGDDFDNNGTNDVVLANFSGDQMVPVRGRQCSSEQMPFIAEKYPTFEGFANASLENILSTEALQNATNYEVASFKSIFLRNDGSNFSKIDLPINAQIAPLRDIVVTDINADGNIDVMGVGNMYGAEVETMRYDAGIGVCLLGDGKGGFKNLDNNKSGFFAPHDARSLVKIKGKNETYLVGNNKEKIQVFQFRK